MKTNVRISAIAKDEGAYLVDWIFHHFYFGFDSIDIYINKTTDNSKEICNKLSNKFNIRVLDGDDFVTEYGGDFQKHVYEHAYNLAKEEGVTNLLFLDIDEFWTPRNFKTSIHEHLEENSHSDIICYEWGIPAHDSLPFSTPFSEHQKILKNYHLKSLFKTSIDISVIGIHNVLSERATYVLADGSTPNFDEKNKATIIATDTIGPLKEVFILHRVARSQVEYVSLLGKGRPSTQNSLKNNRWGFIRANDGVDFSIIEEHILDYKSKLSSLIDTLHLRKDINEARCFVLERFKYVVDFIINSGSHNIVIHQNILKNITLPSVLFVINAVSSNAFVDIKSVYEFVASDLDKVDINKFN
ncbi:glycosyltransferase family 2 protein [Buttiauxella sp.]|uniref:glycosyltransferase family 2 protein n=1 Tax=Buttiauxella sp. TaxID=1972222 RepID=UPI003C70DC7F